MNFNLNDYETVDERLKRFYKDYKNGRIITEMVHYDDSKVVFKAYLYKSFDDEKVWATGYAEETRAFGNPVNKTAHLENCETSAIGRALANAGYSGDKRPTREEMQKVAYHSQAPTIPAQEDLDFGGRTTNWRDKNATASQLAALDARLKKLGYSPKPEDYKNVTAGQASDFIGNKIDDTEIAEIMGILEK